MKSGCSLVRDRSPKLLYPTMRRIHSPTPANAISILRVEPPPSLISISQSYSDMNSLILLQALWSDSSPRSITRLQRLLSEPGKFLIPLLTLLSLLPALALAAPGPRHFQFTRDFAPAEGWVNPLEKPQRKELCL